MVHNALCACESHYGATVLHDVIEEAYMINSTY